MKNVRREFTQLLKAFNSNAPPSGYSLPKPTVLPFYTYANSYCNAFAFPKWIYTFLLLVCSTDDAPGLEEDDITAACLEPKKKFRILSLDGGGIRGILTTILIQRIQQEVPEFMSKVDLIAGTSAGGLVGLMLAAGNYLAFTSHFCNQG